MAKSTEEKQGRLEWFTDRWGKITGSERIGTLMAANPHNLNRLLDEIRWQHANRNPVVIEDQYEKEADQANQYMRWGKAHEEEAVRTYQMRTNSDVIWSPGFLRHPDWPDLCGVSQDFIDTTNNWLGEVKCPGKPENHVKTIKYGMGPWHVNQVQLGLECNRDVDFLIFCSYDPRHPIEKDRLYTQIVKRDPKWVEKFRRLMGEFSDHFKNNTEFRHPVTTTGGEGVPQLF